MKKKYAFSLAEALITLLIVSLITVAAAPVITKKTKQKSDLGYWATTNISQNAIMPVNNKNIVLGTRKGSTNSIVVTGVLEFKNQKGETIGWISEDGSSSFDCNCASASNYSIDTILENQQKIFELVSLLQKKLEADNRNAVSKQYNKSDNLGISEEQLQSYINDIINNMNINR